MWSLLPNTALIQAIAVAKRKSAGRAIHADFQLRADKGIFEVEILKTNKLTLVTIDAQTDKIIGSTAVGTINELSGDQRNAIAAKATAKLKLEDAAAQGDELGDWAVDAGVEMIGGKSAYRVDILKDAKLGTVAIDPDSGKVMQ